ncbi:MAG TPA: endonuclease/exonuclease/phosphatase family protein [Kiritimatiellia bacterium]|jgi:endonuclease/exonuclease/phosphatase family metal-dependent hydrolase|nr:endonuclease/exonuclease/phosphatase family protein [Kiritimatiellia bacterium]
MLSIRHRQVFTRAALFLFLLTVFSSQAAQLPAHLKTAKDEFSVMTWNLMRYAHEDRDGDGQEDDLKPQKECEAIFQVIADEQPDIVAVQEMGNPDAFAHFTNGLTAKGLRYPHVEYLRRGGKQEINMAVLSRFPIAASQPITNDTYSIGPAKLPVARGFINVDIQPAPHYRFKLITAHLKAKVFHPLGQTEMRRNEARLLNKHVRQSLRKKPNLPILVVGDMNDTYNSAALREVIGKDTRHLFDIRPRDQLGTVWTYYGSGDDTYSRIDYMLASRGMAQQLVKQKCRASGNLLCREGSDHRPLLSVFRIPSAP